MFQSFAATKFFFHIHYRYSIMFCIFVSMLILCCMLYCRILMFLIANSLHIIFCMLCYFNFIFLRAIFEYCQIFLMKNYLRNTYVLFLHMIRHISLIRQIIVITWHVFIPTLFFSSCTILL